MWLAKLRVSDLRCVLSEVSSADRVYKPKHGPSMERTFPCLTCSKEFDTLAKMTTHAYKSHGTRNPLRLLVTTPKCPLCNKTTRNLAQAQQHFQRACGKQATPETILIMTRAIQQPATSSKKTLASQRNQTRPSPSSASRASHPVPAPASQPLQASSIVAAFHRTRMRTAVG